MSWWCGFSSPSALGAEFRRDCIVSEPGPPSDGAERLWQWGVVPVGGAAAAGGDPIPVIRVPVFDRNADRCRGTVALKHALVSRGILPHATVRSPLLPLAAGADVEIADALKAAGII